MPARRVDAGSTIDGGDPGVDAAVCYGSAAGYERVCLAAAPSHPATLPDTINTDLASSCEVVVSATTPACVIAGTTVTVGGTVRAIGSRPLVVIASGTLLVDLGGTIDVASRRGGPNGAGANASTCGVSFEATGSGGGAGGSYGNTGGSGGDGASGGSPGTPGPELVTPMLRGGCPGGAGGNSSADQAGQGGGALDLIASTIQIRGTINASGGGGAGGIVPVRGGSGGGSGGQITLDAPTLVVEISASVFANGGGGGEGAGTGSTGDNGDEPVVASIVANGGFGTNANAGDGGNGAYRDILALPGDPGISSAAGGGGGGGVGVIKIFATTTTLDGVFSPTPQ